VCVHVRDEFQVQSNGYVTLKQGLEVVNGGMTLGGGLVSTGGTQFAAGNAVFNPGGLLVTASSPTATAFDVYSSSTFGVLNGRVVAGSGGNILTLTEGLNTLFQVTSDGLTTVGNGLTVAGGSATVASGLNVDGSMLVSGASSISISGAVSISPTGASAAGLDAYASTSSPYTGNAISGRIATGSTANLLMLTDLSSTVLFNVRLP
jgi:filamentous hemagglutinin